MQLTLTLALTLTPAETETMKGEPGRATRSRELDALSALLAWPDLAPLGLSAPPPLSMEAAPCSLLPAPAAPPGRSAALEAFSPPLAWLDLTKLGLSVPQSPAVLHQR